MSLQAFNELKNKAKALGIDPKGMKKADIEAAIAKLSTEPVAEEQTPAAEEQPVNVEVTVNAENVMEVTTPKLGRPVNTESARQKRIAERLAKLETGGIKRGRPVVAGSTRQEKLAKLEAKKAAGIEIKRGRPKMEKKVEVVVEVAPVIEAVETPALAEVI